MVQFVYGTALVQNVFAPLLVHMAQQRQPVQNLQRMKGKLATTIMAYSKCKWFFYLPPQLLKKVFFIFLLVSWSFVQWLNHGYLRYVLSCGKDSSVKLWDVGTGRLVKQYVGATHMQLRCQVWFHFKKLFSFWRSTIAGTQTGCIWKRSQCGPWK